jgi:uncharacterized protein
MNIQVKKLIPLILTMLFGSGEVFSQRVWFALSKGSEQIFIVGSSHSALEKLPFEFEKNLDTTLPLIKVAVVEKLVLQDNDIGMYDTSLERYGLENITSECRNMLSNGSPLKLQFSRLELNFLAWSSATRLQVRQTRSNSFTAINPDTLIIQKINAAGVKIVPVETSQQALDIFNNLDISNSLKMIDKICAIFKSQNEQAKVLQFQKSMNTAFSSGDYDSLLKINIAYHDRFLLGNNDYKASILGLRNMNFRHNILAAIKQHEKVLVVVGAAHIAGDEGIVNLMKKEGFIENDDLLKSK